MRMQKKIKKAAQELALQMRQIQKISTNILYDIERNVKKEVCEMSELIKKAIEKIDKEMEKSPSYKPFAQYIIDELIVNDEAAEKILDEKKSLSDCYKKVSQCAKPMAENGCACIDDQTVHGWIRQYFDFNSVPEKSVSTQAESNIVNFDIFAGF